MGSGIKGKAALVTALLAYLLTGTVAAQGRRVDVSSYGAIADDHLTDSPNIALAILDTAPGDTLFFPPGTYLISSAVIPASETRVLGSSEGESILRFVGTQQDHMITLSDRTDVEVGYLVIDGNDNPNALNGVKASRASSLYLHHLTIRNFVSTGQFGPHGIYFSRQVTDGLLAFNIIENIAPQHKWGAGIRVAHGSSRNRLLWNTITQTGRGGILANNGSTDLIIRNNTIAGSNGVGLGIELWEDCDRAIIENNTLDHWLSLDDSDYSAVRKNVISDRTGVVKFAGLELAGGSFNVFTDNLVDDGAKVGISVSASSEKKYNFWGYNTVRNTTRWGAQIQGEIGGAWYLYFSNNLFERSGAAGSSEDGSSHGFRVNGDTRYLTLEDNRFSANRGLGLQITGENVDQLSITGNTFFDNSGASVTPDPNAVDLEWSDNAVSQNGANNQLTSGGFLNQKPASEFRGVSVATTNQAISFESASTDPDGSIGRVLWDFGDGIPSTDPNPTHIYTRSGTYRVTLVVWDVEGRGALSEHNIMVFDLEQTVALATPGASFYGESTDARQMDSDESAPETIRLMPNFPNPFSAHTIIQFQVPAHGAATVEVHDMLGRKLTTLFDGLARPGQFYNLEFSGSNLGPGMYFYSLTFGGQSITRAMHLVND